MSELMYEAQKFINAEDAFEARDEFPNRKRKESEDRWFESSRSKSSKQEYPKVERKNVCSSSRREERPQNFTPLKMSIDQVLLQIQDDLEIKWPGKLCSDPTKRSKDLYCRFHRDHGHTTEDCYALKQQIEALIRQGKLGKFVRRDNQQTRPESRSPRQEENKDRQEDRPRDIIGEIRTIVGGLASGGTSRSSRKAYARQAHNILVTQRPRKSVKMDDQVISFSEDDARNIHQPHDDALVMKIDKEQLRPIDIPLVGFTGDKVKPSGVVTLIIEAGELKGDQATTRECYFASLGTETTHQTMKIDEDVFAWTHEDMPGIDPSVICHRLNIDPSIRPIKQKRRVFAPDRNQAISDEVEKLLTAGFIREVYYPDWLANVVMVKKPNGKWRMCVDFTDLNKACPKDSFPLPRIDQNEANHLEDLEETFKTLRQYRMKLNPSKCVFGVSSGKFLGFMVSQRGIEANPDKIKAVLEMTPPRTVKEVQSLTGRVAALNRFVSRATDKCLPFFKTLRKAFIWTDECQKSFEELKIYLTSPPLLSPSQQGETLSLYLTISPTAVSSALIREDGGTQLPVYYTSKSFQGAEERYPAMEKLALALVIAARKLRPYFQSHKIIVLTNHPLRKAMNKPDAAGRLIQWAVELSEFDIEYRPRQAIKAQALADFIAEFTVAEEEPSEERPDRNWEIKIDGSSVKGAGGVGIVFKTPEGHLLKHSTRLQYHTTNNEAEYEALLTSLRIAKELGANRLRIQSDSQLIVGQVNGEYEAREDRMTRYLKLVRNAMNWFDEVTLVQVPHEQNTEVDALAKLASSDEATDQHIEVQYSPSHVEEEVSPINFSNSWMTPITNYLEDETLPSDPVKARKLKVRSIRFILMQGVLYKRGFSLPYLRCLDKAEADYVMREVHEGICGNHSGARSLVHKLMLEVRKPHPLTTRDTDPDDDTLVVRPVGSRHHGTLLVGRRQLKFLVVGIDYFTKWVEAEPLATITEKNVRGFVWKMIICRFGIPRAFISDNGQQFDNSPFREFCEELGIRNHYSSPGHPQANGQVEVTNRFLLKMIKTLLEGAKGLWPEELPNILWAYRTTARTPTGETPFLLTYGIEAVIPVEIGLTTWRTSHHDEDSNDNPTQGKLGPTWEGPYRVIKFHRSGTYHLEKIDGTALPHPWNAEHLKKYYQ
uniref:Uncharacterized protein n=1 Tax=Fagus sylvatica TaxID=28930 RepID=A0A2N9G1P7_FAGSY